jgi:hypothetical protein
VREIADKAAVEGEAFVVEVGDPFAAAALAHSSGPRMMSRKFSMG